MKTRHIVATLLLLPAPLVFAADRPEMGEFQISPRLGKSTLDIKGEVQADHRSTDVDTLATGVTFGYVSPFGAMLEGGYSKQGNWDWFGATDEYKLSEYSLAIGWQIDTPHGFRIVPKVGRTRWDLFSKQYTFADVTTVGRREDERTIRGYDDFWELTLQKEVTQSIALGVTYKDNRYDFGNVRSIAFTATFGL